MRLGSSVSPSRSLRSARPMRTRLVTSPALDTAATLRRRVARYVTACSVRSRPGHRAGEPDVHVVIMGCGRVGSALARSLEKLGHTVAVIDRDPGAFRRLSPEFAGTKVTGIGFDRDTLS